MTDAAPTTILQDIFRRLSRSLLQYVRDAFPWIGAGDQERLAVLKRLIAEEERAAAGLARFLQRRRVTVLPGVYPQHFTTINYLSLDHLLPHLIAHEKQELAALERDVSRLWDDLEAREQAQAILDLLRRHLQALEQLAGQSATTPA